MDTSRELAARRLAGELEQMIKRAREHGFETVAYVLETARIEALRASQAPAPNSRKFATR
jgi:hypothetical protein